MTFPKADLEALGWPDRVTVTVEPGNALQAASVAVVQAMAALDAAENEGFDTGEPRG